MPLHTANAAGVAATGLSNGRRVIDLDDEFANEFDDDLEWDEEAEKSVLQIEAAFETQSLSQSLQKSKQLPNSAAQRDKRHLSSDEAGERMHANAKHARTGEGDTSRALSVAAEMSVDHKRVEALLQQLAGKEAELQESRRKLQAKDGEVTILRTAINRTIAEYSEVVREKEEKLMLHHAAQQKIKQANDELQAENKTLKSFRTFEAGTNPRWSSATASVARRRAAGQMSVSRDYSQSHSQTMAAAVGLTTPTRRNRNAAAAGDGSIRDILSSPTGDQTESPSSRRARTAVAAAHTPHHPPSSASLAVTNGSSGSTARGRKGRAAFPGFINSFARPILAQETQTLPQRIVNGQTEARDGSRLPSVRLDDVEMEDDEVFQDRMSAKPSSQSEVRNQGPSQNSENHTSPEALRPQTPAPVDKKATTFETEEARQQRRRAEAQLRYLWAVKTYSHQQGFLASLILSHSSEPCVPSSPSSTLQRMLRPTMPADCSEALLDEYNSAVHHFLYTLSHGTAVDAEERFLFLQDPLPDEEESDTADDWQYDCLHLMDAGMMEVLRGTIIALRVMMAVSFKVGAFAHVYDVLVMLRSIAIHFLDAIHAVVEQDVSAFLMAEEHGECVDGAAEAADGEASATDADTSQEHADVRRQRKQEKKLELKIERVLIGCVHNARSRRGEDAVKSHDNLVVLAAVSMLDVLAYHTRHNDTTSLQCAFKVEVVLSEPNVLTTLLDAKHACVRSVGYTLDILAQLCQHDSLWRVALAAPRQAGGDAGGSARPYEASSTALFEVLAKLLVDGRLDMGETALHRTHCITITFLSQLAVCHPEEGAPLVAQSGPVLAALIKCLQLDTDSLWISSALELPEAMASAGGDVAAYVVGLNDAVARVCMDVRLMALVYRDPGDGSSTSRLAQTLVSPQSQLLLNGIRHYFVVALSRIAFQSEPTWMESAAAAAIEGVESARAALNECNDVAAELLESVLAPDEMEACWEALADEYDEEEQGGDEGMEEV